MSKLNQKIFLQLFMKLSVVVIILSISFSSKAELCSDWNIISDEYSQRSFNPESDYRYRPPFLVAEEAPTVISDINGLVMNYDSGILSWTPSVTQAGTHHAIVTYDFFHDSYPYGVRTYNCELTIVVNDVTPTIAPIIWGDYHSAGTSYTVGFETMESAHHYELYEAKPAAINTYYNIASIPVGSTVILDQSQLGKYRYKYKGCIEGNQCSALSPHREINIYGRPAAPSSLNISPTTVIEGNNFTVSWGNASGLVSASGGRIKLYQRVANSNETLIGTYTGSGS